MTDNDLLKLLAQGVAHLLRDVRHLSAKNGIYTDASASNLAERIEAMADSLTADEMDALK